MKVSTEWLDLQQTYCTLTRIRRTLFDVPWSGGNEILLATLAEIGLPNRLVTSMRSDGVVLVGAFVQLNEFEVLRRRGLGRKSFAEAKKSLAKFGLSLGLELQGWDDDLALESRKSFGRRLHQKVFELSEEDWEKCPSLESELMALLIEVEDERNAEMLSCFFGFDEAGPKTLESVDQLYGLTRERVRQIAARAEKKLKAIWRPTNKLFAAQELLISGIQRPFTQANFAKAAKKAGITRIDFHIEGVLRALELIGVRHFICHTKIGKVRLYGKESELELPPRLLRILRKETSANGCTNIHRLALLVGLEIDDAHIISKLVSYFPEVHWLDFEKIWLLSKRSTRNRLANIAGRIFSVARSVEINELRAALLRPTRVNFVPPANVLTNFLEVYGIAKVHDRRAIAEASLEQTELGINDTGLAWAFQELGSPVTREQLESYCLDDLGMNASSFYVYLSYSPLVVKLATGVFSLIGAEVHPGTIEQMKAEIKERKFEASDGWSKAGTLWWHFQTDRPTIHSGAHAAPAFVLNYASGEWVVKTVDGLKLGVGNVENGFISGLKLAFSVLGASNKDFVQIDFDIASRAAFVRIVGDEPE